MHDPPRLACGLGKEWTPWSLLPMCPSHWELGSAWPSRGGSTLLAPPWPNTHNTVIDCLLHIFNHPLLHQIVCSFQLLQLYLLFGRVDFIRLHLCFFFSALLLSLSLGLDSPCSFPTIRAAGECSKENCPFLPWSSNHTTNHTFLICILQIVGKSFQPSVYCLFCPCFCRISWQTQTPPPLFLLFVTTARLHNPYP